MKIIKRNGSEATFDSEKIVAAITKANNSEEGTRLSPEQIHDIADYVEYKCNKIGRAVSVEEVQDMVENQIMATGAFDLAKHYVQYRYQRSLIRKSNTTDTRILSLIECNNEEAKQENSNKNPTVNSVQRDYMAGEVSRDLTQRLLLPSDIVEADQKGLIHFHDSDYFAHDLRSEGYLLRHKKSGARIALLSNEDENKVFYIGFKTPPADSTGVAHILEHSVLEGSKEFPVKDPFIELVKGSMNTFLNAMTYPDKTMYPVASCNDKDFANLMHVYMDAVFYPDIYKQPNIFYQEGWHYEMENASDELKLNGVVYNEMKGAFSSPDDVLDREIVRNLFPDTIYANESGGDPDVIPNLTYEQFLDFHRKYYHPANSYIYLYGNMDMVERLNWMDGFVT